nr:penicillin-binding transpeptidase domain-containing protein [Dongshaea marina]
MVVSDWRRAEVTAVVGGRDPHYAGFNRALDARRPIGSLIKPLVYATALENGYRLSSPLQDEPLVLKSSSGGEWRPRNYDRKFRGQVLLYEALAKSLNVPTVRLGMAVGVNKLVDVLHQLGVEHSINPYPSLLLGSLPLSPLEMNQLYQPLLTGGLYQPLSALREVTDRKGNVVWQRHDITKRIFSPQVSFLDLYNMTEVIKEGTGRYLKWRFPGKRLAGKTGTSDKLRDSWFAGADNRELVSVWVGHDDNKSVKLTGAAGALRLFAGYFKLRGVSSLELNVPQGVEWAQFSKVTGAHVAAGCSDSVRLPVRSSKLEPEVSCDGSSARSWWNKLFG